MVYEDCKIELLVLKIMFKAGWKSHTEASLLCFADDRGPEAADRECRLCSGQNLSGAERR